MTINYIDDSTNIISTKNHNNIRQYLQDYYDLLHNYYNINKLKINPDKNKILINNRPKLNTIFKNFTFTAKQYTIHKNTTIKLLGTYIRQDLKLDNEIGQLTSKLHNRIHNLRQIK